MLYSPLSHTFIAAAVAVSREETAGAEIMNTDTDEEVREIYDEYSRQLELRLREFSGSSLG